MIPGETLRCRNMYKMSFHDTFGLLNKSELPTNHVRFLVLCRSNITKHRSSQWRCFVQLNVVHLAISSAQLQFSLPDINVTKQLCIQSVCKWKVTCAPEGHKLSSALSGPKWRWKWRQMQSRLYEFLLHLHSVQVKSVGCGDKSTLNPLSNVELTSHAWL